MKAAAVIWKMKCEANGHSKCFIEIIFFLKEINIFEAAAMRDCSAVVSV